MGKFLRVDWKEYGRLCSILSDKITMSGKQFDLVIGIARGGVPLAMVVADQIGSRMDIINVKSYTGIMARKKPRVVSTITNKIKGKQILLIDDLVDHGDTARFVTQYLKRMEPKSITTAVLFKKPQSTFTPDFYTRSTDKWIVFPWEIGELKRSGNDVRL